MCASEALCDSADETDREVSSLTDRAFRSLCIGDEAVYNDGDTSSPLKQTADQTMPLTALANQMLPLTSLAWGAEVPEGGWPTGDDATMATFCEQQQQQQQLEQLSYLSNGSMEALWQQRQQSSSRVSSLIKAFSTGGDGYYDNALADAMAGKQAGGESWDRAAMLSLQQELNDISALQSGFPSPFQAGFAGFPQGFGGFPQGFGPMEGGDPGNFLWGGGKMKGGGRLLNATNLFLHSEFSPFQAWSSYKRQPSYPPQTSMDCPPRWYDSPLYKELTAANPPPPPIRAPSHSDARRTQRRQVDDWAQAGAPMPGPETYADTQTHTVTQKAWSVEKRCESELAANGAPWKRLGGVARGKLPTHRPATVSPTTSEGFRRPEQLQRPGPAPEDLLPSDITPLPSSSTPFNISQLLTPVLPPRVGTDCSELSMGAPVLADGEQQQQQRVEVRQLRDGYKARASSLLFNLKDNRKRVKNTYSPTRFRTQDGDRSSRQPSRLDGLQADAAEAAHTLQADTEDTHTYEPSHTLLADEQLTNVPSHTVDTLRDVPLHTLEMDAATHTLGMDVPVHAAGDPTQTLDMDTLGGVPVPDEILPAPPLPKPPKIIEPPAPPKLSPPSIEVTMAPSSSPLPPPSETSASLASAEELPLFSDTREGGYNPTLPPISAQPPVPSPGPPAPYPIPSSPSLMPSSPAAVPLGANGPQDYLSALPGGVAPGAVPAYGGHHPTHTTREPGLYHMHKHTLPTSVHTHPPNSQPTAAARAHADTHTLPDTHVGQPVEHASVSAVTRSTHTPTHTQAYPQPHMQPYPQAQTPTHTQAYPQAYTPTYTQAYPQAYTPSHTQPYPEVSTPSHTQAYPQVSTPSHTQAYPPYPQTQTPSYTQPYPLTQTPTYTQAYPQAYTPSHTQPYPPHTQAYPQAYTPTQPYPPSYPQAQTLSHPQTYLQVPHNHTHTQGHTPPHSQAYLNPYPPAHTQAYPQPYAASHTQAYVPTHTQPYAPTHTHAHTLPHTQPYPQADSVGVCENSTTVVIEPPDASIVDPYNLPHTHAHTHAQHTLSPYYYNPTHSPHTHTAYQYNPYTHSTQPHNPYAHTHTHSHDMAYYGAPYAPHAYDAHRHDGQHLHDPYALMGAPSYGEQNTHMDSHGYPSHETAAQHYNAPYTPHAVAEPQGVYGHDNTQVFADVQHAPQVDAVHAHAHTSMDMQRYSPTQHVQHTLPGAVNGVSEQTDAVASREPERRAQNVATSASDAGSSEHDLPKSTHARGGNRDMPNTTYARGGDRDMPNTTYARGGDRDMSNTTYAGIETQHAMSYTTNESMQSAQPALFKGPDENIHAQKATSKDTAGVAKQSVPSKNTSAGRSEKDLSKTSYTGMATQSTMSESTAGSRKSNLSNERMTTNERMDTQTAPPQSKAAVDRMEAQTGESKAIDGPAKRKPEQTTPPSQREPSKISPQTPHKGTPLTPFNARKHMPYKDPQPTPEKDTALTPYSARKQRQLREPPSEPDMDPVVMPYNTRKHMPYNEPPLSPRKDTEWLPYVTRAYGPLKDNIQSGTEATTPSKDTSRQQMVQERLTDDTYSRKDAALDAVSPTVVKETEKSMRMLEERRRNGSSRPELKEQQSVAKVIQEDDRQANRDVIPDYKMKQNNGKVAPDYGTKNSKDKTMLDYSTERQDVEVVPNKRERELDREVGGDTDKRTVQSRAKSQESTAGPVASSSKAQHIVMDQRSEDKHYTTTNSQPKRSTDTTTNTQPGNKRNSEETTRVIPTASQPPSLPISTNNNLPAKNSLAYTTPTTEKSAQDSHPERTPTPVRSQSAPSGQPPNTQATATQHPVSDHSQSKATKQTAVTSTTKQPPRRMTPIMPRKLFLNNVQPVYKPSSSISQRFATNNNQKQPNSQPTTPSEPEPPQNTQESVANKLTDNPTGNKEISSESQHGKETSNSPKPIRAQVFTVGNQPEPMKSRVDDVVKLPEPIKSTVDVVKLPEAVKSKADDTVEQPETNKPKADGVPIPPEAVKSKVDIGDKLYELMESKVDVVGKLPEPVQPKENVNNKPKTIKPEADSMHKPDKSKIGTTGFVPEPVKSKVDAMGNQPEQIKPEPIKSEKDGISVQPEQIKPKVNAVNSESEPPIKTKPYFVGIQADLSNPKVDRVVLPDPMAKLQSTISAEAQSPPSNSTLKPNQSQSYALQPTNEKQESTEMATNANPQATSVLSANSKLPYNPPTSDQNTNLQHLLPNHAPTQTLVKQFKEQNPTPSTNKSQQQNTMSSIYSTTNNPLYAREPMAGEAGQDLTQPVREERFSITDILSIRDRELMRRERLKEIRLGDVTQPTNQAEPEPGHAAQTKDGTQTGKNYGPYASNTNTETSVTADKGPGKVLSTKERAQTKQELLTSKVKAHAQKEISALKEKGFLSKNTPKPLPMATKEKAAEPQQASGQKEITADKLNHLFKDLTRYGDAKEPEADNLWQIPHPEGQVLEPSALLNNPEQVESTGLPFTNPEHTHSEQDPTSVKDGQILKERETAKSDTYAQREIAEAKTDRDALKQADAKSNTEKPRTQVGKERSVPTEEGDTIVKERGHREVSSASTQISDSKDKSQVKKSVPSDVKQNDVSEKVNNVTEANKSMLASDHQEKNTVAASIDTKPQAPVEADSESTTRQNKTLIQPETAVIKSTPLHVQPETSKVEATSSTPTIPASHSHLNETDVSSKVQQKDSGAQPIKESSLPQTAPPPVDHMTPETSRKADDITTGTVDTKSSSEAEEEKEDGFFLEIQSICGYVKPLIAWADSSSEDTGKGRPGLTVRVIEHGKGNDEHKGLTESSGGEAMTDGTREESGRQGFTVTVIERDRRRDEQSGSPDSSKEVAKTDAKQTQHIDNTEEDQNKQLRDKNLEQNQDQQNKQEQNRESQNEQQEELKEEQKQEPQRPLKEDQLQEHKKVSGKVERIKAEEEKTQRARDNRAFIRKVEEKALAKDSHSFMRKGEVADKDANDSESTVGKERVSVNGADQTPKMVDKQQPEKMEGDVNVSQEVTVPSRGESELSRLSVERGEPTAVKVKVDEGAAKHKETPSTDTETHATSPSQTHTAAEMRGGRGTTVERQKERAGDSTEAKARVDLKDSQTTQADNPDSTSDAPQTKPTAENTRGKASFTSNDNIKSRNSADLKNEAQSRMADPPADAKDLTQKAKDENVIKPAADVSAKPDVGGETPKQKTQEIKGAAPGSKASEDSTQKRLADTSSEPQVKARATEEEKYSIVASRELISAIQTQDILDAKVDARAGRRPDTRQDTMTARDASTLAAQREAWRSAREGGKGKERGRGMREGGARERGQSLDRDVGMRDRRVSVDRERGGRERGVSMDRERPARERGGSVDRERPTRERGISVERDRPRERGVSIDRERPARERGQSVDRERERREYGSRDQERGRAAVREQRTGGSMKARQERETAMDRGRGETEVQFKERLEDSKSHNVLQSTERAGRGRQGRMNPSEKGTGAPPAVTQANISATIDTTKSHKAESSSETQKQSIATTMQHQEDPARKDTKDTTEAPRGRTPIQLHMRSPEPPQPPAKHRIQSRQPQVRSPEPPEPPIRSPHPQPQIRKPEPPEPPIRSPHPISHIRSPEPPQPRLRSPHPQSQIRSPHPISHIRSPEPPEPPIRSPNPQSQIRSPEPPEPPIRNPHPPIRSPQPAQPSVDSARVQMLKEPSRVAERQQTRSASRPEISALADYARLRVLPDREDDITNDDTSFPVSLAYAKSHTAVATEVLAGEPTLESFTADKARREAEANMARVLRYREREKHAGSRMPDFRRSTESHAGPASTVATKDHRKEGQNREPIKEEDKVSQAELRLTALAQSPQVKGRRRGASLPREAIRDRSAEREFYPAQRGRPGVPRNASQGPAVVAVERGPETQTEETPEQESEPLQYYSVSSQEPEPKPLHTKHTHILQPAQPAHKHTLQPAYDPEGLKHTQGQPIGRGRVRENGFIQDYTAAPMAEENFVSSDHPAVMRNDRHGNDTTGRDVGMDNGRSKAVVTPRLSSNPSSPAFGKPIMFNVKDNTFRVSSVTKAVKPRLHRTSFSERPDDYLPGDRTNPSPSPQPHPIRAFHQQSRDAYQHTPATYDGLPPAESPAPRDSVGRFRRSLALDDEDARSVASMLSEDTDAGYYGYGDSESERPESACSLSSQSGRPPPVAPKSEKALRRAKRLTSRHLRKAAAKTVASVPSSPTQVLSEPLQLPNQHHHHHHQQPQPHTHAQYHVSAGYAPAPGVVSPASFSVSQRKLLQDPSSGQLFMVDVPLPTVKTKTFFDPQTGKYVRLNVRQPAEAARAVPAAPQYMMYPGTAGYLPMPLSSLPTRRSASQMSAPATLMQDELDLELVEPVERPVPSGRLQQQQQQQQQACDAPAPAPAYKEPKRLGIITMTELEDFAVENA
ncbi:uncharacterized protein LOC134441271 [Engraulis encrasicolus]|uniref:uncharacterized protein LOC134441271 n=1 Tax=Engraulis encrasicolus TaxID=184585 RepID=UPI002FD25199